MPTAVPRGRIPSGVIVITALAMPFPGDIERGQSFTSPVTCLNVQGNRATIGTSASLAIGPSLTTVEDNGGGGLDRFGVTGEATAPTQCPAPPAPGSGGLVADGHFAVHDATPLPSAKDQCKNAGWHNYPQFKNQGQCIAFVNHGP